MTTTTDNTTRPVNFIRFHGLMLLVVENGGVEYIEVKPLTDLCGMDWKSAKRTVQSGDNAVLYGTKLLLPPKIAGSGGTRTPLQESLCIRIDRAHMFLARVNTSNMKAKGAVEAAEQLLALQMEWATALHQYETSGYALKKGHKEGFAELTHLFKTRALADTAAERQALTLLIKETFEVLGHPLPADPQQALPL